MATDGTNQVGMGGMSSGFGASSFLPSDYVQRKAELRNNIVLLSTFAVVMGGIGAAFFKTQRDWRHLRDTYTLTSEQYVAEGEKIEQLKQLEVIRGQMMEKAQITASLIEKVPRHAMLAELTLRMKPGMTLQALTLSGTREEVAPPPPPNQSGATSLAQAAAEKAALHSASMTAPRYTYEVSFTGYAQNNNDIADYLANLKQSPIFTNVELSFIREATLDGETVRSFEMNLSLRTEVTQETIIESINGLMAERGQVAQAAPGSVEADLAKAQASVDSASQEP
jgi:Tfp pilus assembly protein PilN